MKELQISKEFKGLIPPLTNDEYDLLEQNILKEGIRDPIIVYDNVIVDGHNRFEIAQKHNLKFDIIDKKFNSTDEAKVWIIENQLGRRNISDFAKYELLEIKELSNLSIIGKSKQIRKSINSVLSTVDKKSHNTRKIIANTLGWSTGKVGMAKVVKQKADEETLQELREGKITINGVYKKIKKTKNSSIQDKPLPIIDKDLIKYELMVPTEMNKVVVKYMEDSKTTNKDKAIVDLLSIGIYYYYYVKEEE